LRYKINYIKSYSNTNSDNIDNTYSYTYSEVILIITNLKLK